ncbi:ABC transporter ATP-binding protein [Nocardioides massiliensis]|uniref:Branched-chain amino acid transport system ATP-binding protein n=1 Tax=Nocardioides massiliensis TaxID=1325935 RepID=A0ABT9NSR4_9ACTN|nr:ABC transporter ATP-binding protein [Nocardioides massiliensis]MDP9823467.1 branched-chain amino acid transport system ATP-binding protein [Nocardioides massiliensis]
MAEQAAQAPARTGGSNPLADPAARKQLVAGIEAVPGSKKPDPIMSVDNIVRNFGGITAVDVDHLEVQRGIITALIGPNGAGKTTFFNLITGFDRPTSAASRFGRNEKSARWSFEGKSLANTSASKVSRAGMVRTFQLTKALSRMTVMDNMMLGARDQTGENLFLSWLKPSWAAQEREIEEKAKALLDRFRLLEKKDDYAGSLSGGQRKLLEMARALMTDPTMIMLDEPMAGVNPALTQSLLGHIQALRDEGMTVLFVEHDMHMVRHISDWVVVMAEGKVVAEGDANTVMADPAVIDAYLGAHHDTDLGDDALLSDETMAGLAREAEAEAARESGEEKR